MARPGRPKIDPAWKDYCFSQFENVPKLSIPRLATMVVDKAEREGREDYPSPRTLTRWRKEWKDLPADARNAYRWVSWPQTFQAGLLPWESAEAVLELMYVTRRPDIRLANWYWRVTQAAPDMLLETRHTLAANLAHWESRAGADNVTPRGAEALLSYAPWRSQRRAEVYGKALAAGRVPVPPVLKLEYLEDIDRLQRSTPEEVAALFKATAEAIAKLEKERENERASSQAQAWKDF